MFYGRIKSDNILQVLFSYPINIEFTVPFQAWENRSLLRTQLHLGICPSVSFFCSHLTRMDTLQDSNKNNQELQSSVANQLNDKKVNV